MSTHNNMLIVVIFNVFMKLICMTDIQDDGQKACWIIFSPPVINFL